MRKEIVVAFMLLFAITVYAATVTTTVKYIVPNDLSFTVSYPAGTTEAWFEPTSQTDEVNATNQTSTQSIILYTNTGNKDEYFDIKIDTTNPATIVLKAGPKNGAWQNTCNCQGSTNSPMTATQCCNITTVNSRVNSSSLSIGGTQSLWLWGKFVSSPAGTTTRTLTSTSGAS